MRIKTTFAANCKVVFFYAMKNTLLTIFTFLILSPIFGQGSDDACLFSQSLYQGTAKAMGMGNALGAVGGDMTGVCINPAGMGLYRSNEFTATLGLMHNLNASRYYGNATQAGKYRTELPNFGYVSSKQRSNYKGIRFTQFGIGFTRTNDYNIHTFAKGINPTSSKIDNYLAQIDGYDPTELQDNFAYTIYPAWNTYLIDLYQDEQGEYYSSPVPQGGIWQSQENSFKGRSEEYTFALSANYQERLFMGASLGITHIKREGIKAFEESALKDEDIDFNQWNFTESIASTGWGCNAKLGFIFHANSWFRLGLAYHTRGLYAFDETWQTETESKIEHVTYKSFSPNSTYNYNFRSPRKWIGSMAFVIRQAGLIGFDAEYTNYGAARFTCDDFDYSHVNKDIADNYGKTFNFRLGSEWNLGASYLRAGLAYYGSPFGLKESLGSVKKASFGFSLPVNFDTTFDFAYELSYSKSNMVLYDAGVLGIEPVVQRQFRNNVAVTLKVKF